MSSAKVDLACEADTICSHCSKPAKLMCNGCIFTPPDDELTSSGEAKVIGPKTYYCNATCQKKDWASHKQACHYAQALRSIYRIGTILQTLFYKFRECIFDCQITGCEEKDGDLIVRREFDADYMVNGCPSHWRFPVELMATEEDKFGVLALMASDDAMAFMHEIAKHLLSYVATASMEEIKLKPKNHGRRVLSCHESGQLDVIDETNHSILGVTLAMGRGSFVFDLTGAQYGHFQTVTRSSRYWKERVESITPRREGWFQGGAFGSYHSDMLDLINRNAIQSTTAAFQIFVSTALLHGVQEWELNNVAIKKMLKMEEKDFQASLSGMLEVVEVKMRHRKVRYYPLLRLVEAEDAREAEEAEKNADTEGHGDTGEDATTGKDGV